MTLRHVVAWKLATEDPTERAAQAQKIADDLNALAGVVPEIERGNFDADRATRVRRQRIHGKRVLRKNDLIARQEEGLRDEFQDVVGAVAKNNLTLGNAVAPCQRGLQLVAADARMRMRRAQEIGMGLARPVDVVGIAALAGDETVIFLAANCGADSGGGHGFLLA